MSYNIIPKSKFGNCSKCGKQNTSCIKSGKSLYCIECREFDKKKKQLDKAEKRDNDRFNSNNSSDNLQEDLDLVFSRYIRLRSSDINGECECYTCGKKMNWKQLQCGHFIGRSNTLLRWDTRNARPQCVECNCYKNGNIEVFREKLDEEFPGLTNQLTTESRLVNKFTHSELISLLHAIRFNLKLVESRYK